MTPIAATAATASATAATIHAVDDRRRFGAGTTGTAGSGVSEMTSTSRTGASIPLNRRDRTIE